MPQNQYRRPYFPLSGSTYIHLRIFLQPYPYSQLQQSTPQRRDSWIMDFLDSTCILNQDSSKYPTKWFQFDTRTWKPHWDQLSSQCSDNQLAHLPEPLHSYHGRGTYRHLLKDQLGLRDGCSRLPLHRLHRNCGRLGLLSGNNRGLSCK